MNEIDIISKARAHRLKPLSPDVEAKIKKYMLNGTKSREFAIIRNRLTGYRGNKQMEWTLNGYLVAITTVAQGLRLLDERRQELREAAPLKTPARREERHAS
jgi:hypothetical protein